ncbi:ribbon-helix-helix domain-containing protein [Zeimonas arvi]|nr:ribbon-helix-helix protein, CopG family [Zeimonas arvi]
MPQINLHVTPDFEAALDALVKGKHLPSKSEAIRYAVQEAAAPYLAVPRRDFSLLEGLLDRHRESGAKHRPVAELERELDTEMEQALHTPKVRPGRGGSVEGGAARARRKARA